MMRSWRAGTPTQMGAPRPQAAAEVGGRARRGCCAGVRTQRWVAYELWGELWEEGMGHSASWVSHIHTNPAPSTHSTSVPVPVKACTHAGANTLHDVQHVHAASIATECASCTSFPACARASTSATVQTCVLAANRASSAMRKQAQRQQRTDSLSSSGSRLSQIREWLQGPDEDGRDALIIFDECHVSERGPGVEAGQGPPRAAGRGEGCGLPACP